MRRTADIIMSYAGKLMPVNRGEWAQAMRAELGHINRPFAALWFAVGCFQTALIAHLKTARWEPIGRAILCFHVAVWVFAKFYAGIKLSGASQDGAIEMSTFQSGLIGVAGFAYLSLAICLLRRKWIVAIGSGLVALALNTTHLMVSIFAGLASPHSVAHMDVLSLAIISEEYFIWTTVLIGGAAIWIWQTCCPKVQS